MTPSIYPVGSKPGVWGPTTSLIDWCESNYEVTHVIAEFWNTISNLVMIIPPFIFAYQAKKENLEKRFIWLQVSIFFVGVGSWLFHMTLRYGMQITDELPMVFGQCFFFYTMFENCQPPNHMNIPLAISLSSYSMIATLVYLYVKDPLIFQAVYGLAVLACVGCALYNIINRNASYQVRHLYLTSLFTYLFAFILWNVDQIFCNNLHDFRTKLTGFSLILSPFSQLHALWHILAAHATYQSVAFNCLSRQIYLGRKCELKMILGFFPYLSFPEKIV